MRYAMVALGLLATGCVRQPAPFDAGPVVGPPMTSTPVAGPKAPGGESPAPKPPRYTISTLSVGLTGVMRGTAYSLGDSTDRIVLSDRGDVLFRRRLWRDGKRVDIRLLGKPADVWDINNRGEALLWLNGEAVVWSNGKLRRTGAAGMLMNDRGDIAGARDTGRQRTEDAGHMPVQMPVSEAVLWSGGTRTGLGAMPNELCSSAPTDVNEAGQVTGTTGEHGERGFLWSKGRMVDLGMPAGYQSVMPVALNNRGQVTGTLTGAQEWSPGQWSDRYRRPFLWQDGRMYDLGTPEGAGNANATGINDAGQVVGQVFPFDPEAGDVMPLLWEHGRWYDLNDLIPRGSGWRIWRPLAINNRGQILALASLNWREGDRTNPDRIVLLTPEGLRRQQSARRSTPRA